MAISENINDVVASIFAIGITIIYIPQFYKLIKTKTGHGFNIWFMFLGHTAAFLSWINALTIYVPAWRSCSSTRECSDTTLGFILIVLQWLLYWLQYTMILYYGVKRTIGNSRILMITYLGSHLIALTTLSCTLYFLFNTTNPYVEKMDRFSMSIGVMIMVMFLSHYIPQLWETWHLKDVGSISLVTLGLMCPGTFAWTIFLALQGYVTGNASLGRWQIWVPYLLVAISQLSLLIMGLYYDYRARQKKRHLLSSFYSRF
jgi:uncharacterized protein with PQ loop repeat